MRIYRKFAEILQRKVEEKRLTEYERQVIRDMTVKVANSLAAKWPNVRKGVGDIMGGAILELEADKILDRGKAEGRVEGRSEGRKEGVILTLAALVRDGLLDLAEGARRANMTQEEFERRVNDI